MFFTRSHWTIAIQTPRPRPFQVQTIAITIATPHTGQSMNTNTGIIHAGMGGYGRKMNALMSRVEINQTTS